jgi:hypothetical protein
MSKGVKLLNFLSYCIVGFRHYQAFQIVVCQFLLKNLQSLQRNLGVLDINDLLFQTQQV